MKRFLLSLSALALFASCNSTSNNTEVTITIDGLKKGTVYLQKITEAGLINLDSVESNGKETLNLGLNLSHPELIYAYLDKADGSTFNDRLAFFAEPGEIQISTRYSSGWLTIEVTDNGCGMTAEQLKRVFDPFYTTKPVGQGTGLGLSLSYGIIKRHGGRIEVKSEVGQGTSFTIWLPEHPESAGEEENEDTHTEIDSGALN